MPESSEMAGSFATRAAWRAFIRAFSMNVVPVSATEWMPSELCVTRSKPSGSNSALISRSFPTLPLARTTRFTGKSPQVSPAPSSACSCKANNCPMPLAREIQHGVELVTAKGVTLGRALDLDKRPAIVHDDVHVSFRVRVLGVVEVQHRNPTNDSDRDGGDLPVQRARRRSRDASPGSHMPERARRNLR